MKIASYEIEQQAASSYTRVEKLELDIQTVRITPQPELPPVDFAISEDALQVTEAENEDLFNLTDEDKAKIKLIEDFISYLTGKKFKFSQFLKMDESSHQKTNQAYLESYSAPQIQMNKNITLGGGQLILQNEQSVQPIRQTIEINSFKGKRTLTETESMTFQSQGVVKTADGKTIDFNVNLEMAYAHAEVESIEATSVSLVQNLVDPIVINFDGNGVAFGEDSIQLDITMDGNAETFRNLAQGSGFLALDKNGNGQIDDGSELFGPSTGSGFDELSTYDSDSNGWIDESDAVFTSLKVWTVSPNGDKNLIGLKEADVGAIFLGKVNSEYNLRSDTEVVAKIRDSSVYLKENGGAGVIHEVDLKV